MINTMLTLSTGNLTPQTCNIYLHTAPFSAFEKGDVGWFVYATDDPPKDLPDYTEHWSQSGGNSGETAA